MDSDLLTTDDAAQLLRVSRRWIQYLVASGDIPCHRVGPAKRLIRFDRAELLGWAKGRDVASSMPRVEGDDA